MRKHFVLRIIIKQENIDLYYKNKPRIFATVPKNVYLCIRYPEYNLYALKKTNTY